jgi:integrase
LRAVFTFALEQGLVHWPENHFKTLQVRTPGKRKKTLSDEQIAKTHEVFSNLVREENENRYSGRIHPTWFWSIVFETLYYTGMRRNQLLNIRLKDVSLGDQTIFLSIQGSKAHSENIIPIPNGLVEALGILLARAKEIRFKPDDQLFNVTRFGTNRYKYKTMQDSNISNAFRELSARLDFPASPHRLRHTLGTKLMRQPEKNLHLVKAIFGHKDIRTTLEYVVPDLEDMRDLLNTMPKLTK